MGGMYRLLSDLEEEELIVAEWETDKPGPAKKIYKITQKGFKRLMELDTQFEDLKQTITSFQNRVRDLNTSNNE